VFDGDGESGILIAVEDLNPPYLAQCDTGTWDIMTTAANITFKPRTRYAFGGHQLTGKRFHRVKVKLGQVTTGGEKHTIRLYGEDGVAYGETTEKSTIGTKYKVLDLSIPYQLDGNNFGVEVEHSKTTGCKLAGVSIASDNGRF